MSYSALDLPLSHILCLQAVGAEISFKISKILSMFLAGVRPMPHSVATPKLLRILPGPSRFSPALLHHRVRVLGPDKALSAHPFPCFLAVHSKLRRSNFWAWHVDPAHESERLQLLHKAIRDLDEKPRVGRFHEMLMLHATRTEVEPYLQLDSLRKTDYSLQHLWERISALAPIRTDHRKKRIYLNCTQECPSRKPCRTEWPNHPRGSAPEAGEYPPVSIA